MSSWAVCDGEIADLLYLKHDSKVACYLGVPESRVAEVRAAKAKPEKITLPAPIEALMDEPPIEQAEVLTPHMCPSCGAPLSQRLMVTHIQALVAAYYKIPVFEMTSNRRAREVSRPRQVAMYLSKQLTPKSLPDIGRRFGGRDHTTVIHAIKVVQRLMLADAEIEADVVALRERLAA